jgi:hypothetical protein
MKFNLLKRMTGKTVNHEGAAAYKLSPEMELYSAVVTAGLSNTFYEKQDKRAERIQTLLGQTKPEFAARLAIYARNTMHLRSVPMVLAVEIAKQQSGNPVVAQTVSGVVQRADEITELLAYYQLANKRNGTKKLNKLSKQVQKGLATSFNKFDEYQFAKYNRATDVKLRDALFLVHPKAKSEEQQALFNKIAKDELAVPYTWEVELSALGQQKFETDAARKNAFTTKWEELIDSKKIGYMAMLRNLRNIIEAEVSYAHMEKVCAYIADTKAVLNAKQLPFRYLAAYREVKVMRSAYASMVIDALEDAVAAAAANIQGFDGNTSVVVACDVSSSMQKPISKNSKVLLYDIGLMLGMLMQSRCKKVVSGMFGNTWKVINMPKRNILGNVDEYYRREGEVGYSTNGYKVIDDLLFWRVKADKVMLFTDVQLWDSSNTGQSLKKSWDEYKQRVPNAKLYLFDLAGYGNVPLRVEQNGVHLIAGWSDKVFDVLNAIENGESALSQINKIVL